jgi:hypothetical protein
MTADRLTEIKAPAGFFRCGFCGAIAPEGKHVCGDHYTQSAKHEREAAAGYMGDINGPGCDPDVP